MAFRLNKEHRGLMVFGLQGMLHIDSLGLGSDSVWRVEHIDSNIGIDQVLMIIPNHLSLYSE